MSKIVPFGSNRAPQYQEFGLEDLSNDTFDASEAVVAVFRPVPDGDWSNQELASIYRAVRLLEGAGVAVATDRGVTDDGSPWCVFCNPNGDVVVHIARIDLAYVLDGVGLDAPLTGKTFDELISRFVSDAAQGAVAERETGLTSVLDLSKHRGNKVFVHPAAQLAALIWAAMMVRDAVAANAAEADWAALADEPQMMNADAFAVKASDSGGVVRQRLPDTSEPGLSDAISKSRDGHLSSIQSAGLLSLGYFLVGSESMSPGAVLGRLKLTAEGEGSAAAASDASANGALMVFFNILEALASLDPAILDDGVAALQENDAAKTEFTISDDLKNDFLPLTEMPEQLLKMGISLDRMIDVHDPNALAQATQDTPDALAVSYKPGPSFTLDDLFNYLAAFEASPLQGNEALVDELASLLRDGETLAPEMLMDDGTIINDSDVIAAVIEFLSSADEPLTFYHDQGVHVIEHGDAMADEPSDVITVAWTFVDGSHIMIVGSVADLHGLDFLF